MDTRNLALNTIKKYDLFSPNDIVVLGVSGGSDSLALLYLLHDFQITLGLRLIVAHLNHNLRGRRSESDERFVRSLALKLNLAYETNKIQWREGIKRFSEESLRKYRYDFFFKTAKNHKANKIVLGHTLDDQAETVLMRIIRGAGLHGLISIAPKRKIGDYTIVRPLIEISKEQVKSYLKKIGVTPRIDETNLKDDFLRNKIRHRLLKEICDINPRAKENLARFAQIALVDYDYFYKEASARLEKIGKSRAEFSLRKFSGFHLALQRMVMRVYLEKLSGSLRTFTFKHWEEIFDLIYNRPVGSVVNITKNIQVRKEKDTIVISRN